MKSHEIIADIASQNIKSPNVEALMRNTEGSLYLSEYEKLMQFSNIIDKLKVSPLYRNCKLHQDMFKNIELLILKNLYNVETL